MDQSSSDLGVAWRGVVNDLQPNQRAWLRASEPVTLHESTAIVAVPNDFTRTQLEGRLRAQLEDALTVRFGREIRIAVTVNPQLEESPVAPAGDATAHVELPSNSVVAAPAGRSPESPESSSRQDDMSTSPQVVPVPGPAGPPPPAPAGRGAPRPGPGTDPYHVPGGGPAGGPAGLWPARRFSLS